MRNCLVLLLVAGSLMLVSCNEAFWQGMAQGAQRYSMGMTPFGYNPYAFNRVSTYSNSSNSSVSKTLKTEKDGFQWYRLYQNGKYGAEDVNHNTLIPLSRGYTMVLYDSYGYFTVYKGDNNKGVCERSGKEIVPPQYHKVMYSYESDYGCRVFYYYPTSSTSYSEVVHTGLTLDENFRAVKAPVKSTLIEDFKYYSYMPIVNGKPDLAHPINSIEGVRFDFASTKGKIIVNLMKDGYSKESVTINPSESSLHTESGVIKISFSEGGTSKYIAVLKNISGSDANNVIMWIDNNSSNNGKFFGEIGAGGGIGALSDAISKYRGSDFDGQFRRLKTELERFSWQRKN